MMGCCRLTHLQGSLSLSQQTPRASWQKSKLGILKNVQKSLLTGTKALQHLSNLHQYFESQKNLTMEFLFQRIQYSQMLCLEIKKKGGGCCFVRPYLTVDMHFDLIEYTSVLIFNIFMREVSSHSAMKMIFSIAFTWCQAGAVLWVTRWYRNYPLFNRLILNYSLQ